MKGSVADPRFIDPYSSYNYELDTLSAAIDAGLMEYAVKYPQDILNKDRTADGGPDLGAYERVINNDEDE